MAGVRALVFLLGSLLVGSLLVLLGFQLQSEGSTPAELARRFVGGTLGLMLADGRSFMLQAPWMVVFPGLAIMLAVLGFNMMADGLRDWLDPDRA